jgi:predicted 3-demethylubiquinone-9 3-methyltransferase (glyoxalase superfamily)
VLQKIAPFLWFDDNAEEAAKFYVSIFSNSRIKSSNKISDDAPGPKGKMRVIAFELEGQEFIALNGGPGVFTFTGAISFFIKCETQEEIDRYWNKLTEGGDPQAQRCGWLKDKYGVYWQIVPTVLSQMLGDPDREKADRVTGALLQMTKLDIAALRNAYDGTNS